MAKKLLSKENDHFWMGVLYGIFFAVFAYLIGLALRRLL